MTFSKDMNLAAEVYDRKFDDLDKKPSRDGFGLGTAQLGRENKDVVVLCADLSDSTRASWFTKEHPERFIEVGIQEQNMMGIAAGMAMAGKVPFVADYAVFAPGRCWDQTRISVCYNQANVKICGAHSGISVGPDGATHQALEDIASVRCLANMTVVAAADSIQTKKAIVALGKMDGPAYIRFHREKVPVITTDDTPFELGKAYTYREGKDVCIVACGAMVYEALKAAVELEKQGVDAMIMNLPTIKPLDEKTIAEAAKRCGCIVTAEEHQINGGMGGAVAESLARSYPVPMEFVAVKDRFGESGPPDTLMKEFGLTSDDIVKAAKKAIGRKGDA